MSLSINNNITSLNAWRNLKQTDSKMSSAMEKLSSGLRINKAADDPAGLVISEKMRAQLAGINAAINNSEKAVNMVQTAEAALDKVQSLLDKMRQLALDSANTGVNDSASLKANQDELDASIDSITRIANYTQFGTKKLLDGTLGTNFTASGTEISSATFGGVTASAKEGTVKVDILTAADQGAVALTLTAALSGGKAAVAFSFQLNGVSISVASGSDVVSTINGYSDQTGVTASVNAASAVLTLTAEEYGSSHGVTYVSTGASGVSGGAGTTADFGINATAKVYYADGTTGTFSGDGLVVHDTTDSSNTMVLSETFGKSTSTGTSVGQLDVNDASFQVGANENQTISLSIASVKSSAIGTGVSGTYTSLEALKSNSSSGNLGVFRSGGSTGIATSIQVIDEAIDQISSIRGNLGAVQSDTLQVQLDSLRVSYENLQASESTIRDTDMTSQMAQFTKYQIMMQAGTAMLAQANQQPNNILQLLR